MQLQHVINAIIIFLLVLTLIIHYYVKSSCTETCREMCADVAISPNLQELISQTFNNSDFLNISPARNIGYGE